MLNTNHLNYKPNTQRTPSRSWWQGLLYSFVTLVLFNTTAFANPTKDILQRFVDDYKTDPMLVETTFGVDVNGDRYHIVVSKDLSGKPGVTLNKGFPEQDVWYFTFDSIETLRKIDERKLNPGTAMVKAFSTDVTPMDIETTENFKPGKHFLPTMLKTSFHFWTRGYPEITPFNDHLTRSTHGSDGVIFYYQPGLRSGWFSIKKGQHVNEDPRSRTNPFPSMLIFTSGKGVARIDGKDTQVQEGEMLFVPPGTSHEFFNNNDQPLQGVLVMFGDGA